jgi:hypothetical protein
MMKKIISMLMAMVFGIAVTGICFAGDDPPAPKDEKCKPSIVETQL